MDSLLSIKAGGKEVDASIKVVSTAINDILKSGAENETKRSALITLSKAIEKVGSVNGTVVNSCNFSNVEK